MANLHRYNSCKGSVTTSVRLCQMYRCLCYAQTLQMGSAATLCVEQCRGVAGVIGVSRTWDWKHCDGHTAPYC
jgi:hypothetical protein